MAWSIAEVARMSKVTSRTLRHYDEIGLLKPAFVASNGYRFYEKEELLRLQQIRLLREVDLDLGTIAQVLDGQTDRVEALRRHEAWLRQERKRLGRLATTVTRTIAQIEGGEDMAAQDLFEGFAERQAQQEEEFVDRYGDGVRRHFETSRAATKGWTKEDYRDAQRKGEALDVKALGVMRSGVTPGSPAGLAVAGEYFAAISQFWTPNRATFRELGRMYVDNPQFKARYDAVGPGLAEFLRDALAAFAEARLG